MTTKDKPTPVRDVPRMTVVINKGGSKTIQPTADKKAKPKTTEGA